MTQIKELFKLQLDNKFVLFKQKSLKAFLMALLKNIVIVAGVTLALLFLLRRIFFYLSIEINAEFIAIVLLVAQGISFCFDIGNIISTMYLSKDNELLMVLPVTFNQLFISKVLILYVSDLMFNVLYILPIFLTIGAIGQLSITFYLMLVVMLPLLPLLPISLAALLSIPIMFVVKYFKQHPLLSVLTIIAIVAVVFVLYMSIVTSLSGAINVAEKQIETSIKFNAKIRDIGESLFIYFYLAKSMLSISYIYIPLLFIVVSLFIMCGCFLFIKPFYYKIATLNTENNTNTHTRYYKFKLRKPFTELVINEIRSVFRSPSYIFQYFLFPLFMPLIVFTYDKLLITIAVNQTGQAMILGSHVLVLSIIALMSNIISSTAISREGGTFYIAKTTPVSAYTQVSAKIVFNAIFTIGSILITTITTLIFTDLNVGAVLLTSLAVMFLSLGHIMHSFDMDLRSPVLDWYDNSEISTIGKSTTKSIIYALILSLMMCMLIILFSTKNMYIACIVALVVSILYAFNRFHLLFVRIKHYYNVMEI